MKGLLQQVRPALVAIVAFTILCGLAYPLAVTGIAQLGWRDTADGSLVERDGEVVGSSLIGQPFESTQYFHPRPSASGYDGRASGGSNLGPTSDVLLDEVAERVAAYREENGIGDDVPVPVDAVTASASGLDPHISVRNARLQAGRVASARGVAVTDVLALVADHTDDRPLGILGDPGVDVLALNLALDATMGP